MNELNLLTNMILKGGKNSNINFVYMTESFVMNNPPPQTGKKNLFVWEIYIPLNKLCLEAVFFGSLL